MMMHNAASPLSMATIGTLPPELLTLTVANLSSPADILHLGLACKSLWESLRERELPYRVIHTHGADNALWAHLATRKDLARNVREFALVSRHAPEIVPRLGGESDGHPYQQQQQRGQRGQPQITPVLALENVCRALSNMPLLNYFEWDFAAYPGYPRPVQSPFPGPQYGYPAPRRQQQQQQQASPIPRAVVQRCVLAAGLKMDKQQLRHICIHGMDTSPECFVRFPTFHRYHTPRKSLIKSFIFYSIFCFRFSMPPLLSGGWLAFCVLCGPF
jgi:hypothetical protein